MTNVRIRSYGMTECSSTTTSQPVDELDRIGKPFVRVSVHVSALYVVAYKQMTHRLNLIAHTKFSAQVQLEF